MRMLTFIIAVFCFVAEARGSGELVHWPEAPAGHIIVSNSARALFWVRGDGYAVRYTVAVGKPERQWTGSTRVAFKKRNPGWRPPA